MTTIETETTALLTAEEYARLADEGRHTELVRGRIVTMNMPYPRHGQVCVKVAYILRDFVNEYDLGCIVCNDAGVVTERGPDTVRGMDVAYYSYNRVARGPLPQGYLPVVPELIFEVLSPWDRRAKVLEKVAEYLEAGVLRVCVLDPDPQTVTVYAPDRPEERLTAADRLTLPAEVLPGFDVAVELFFK